MEPHYWTPTELLDDLLAFTTFLASRCNVRLEEGSSVNTAVSHLLEMIAGLNGEGVTPGDRRLEFAQGIGLADLAVKTSAVIDSAGLASFCTHFALLLQPGGLVQNTRTIRNEEATNKLFELLIALSLLQITPEVDLEDPAKSAGGTNPDVIAKIGETRWSFACKVLNSRSVKTYYDRVAEGLAQIQNASGATRGFVVVNLKNLLDFSALWPAPQDGQRWEDGAWPTSGHLGALAEAQVTRALAGYEDAFGGDDYVAALFCDKAPKAVPMILNYVNVAAPCWVDGRRTFTNLRLLMPLVLGAVDAEAEAVFHRIDRAVATP